MATVIKKEKAQNSDTVQGEDVFRLYDTYGFPVELTEEYAEDENMKIDHAGFEREMEAQRERARAARQDSSSMQVQGGVLGEVTVASEFVGYDKNEVETVVEAIIVDGELVDRAEAGTEAQVILSHTPFYAESGGQIADQGTIQSAAGTAEVKDVQKAPNGQNVQTVAVTNGELVKGEIYTATLDEENRSAIVKNHTATHLLHQALKDTLGTHVNQAGSLVTADRLRFDFSLWSSDTRRA